MSTYNLVFVVVSLAGSCVVLEDAFLDQMEGSSTDCDEMRMRRREVERYNLHHSRGHN